MAYTLIAAKAKLIGYGQIHLDVDLSTLTIKDIFTTYNSVILTLGNSFLGHSVYLNLINRPSIIIDHLLTIPQWLIANGNATLPTTDITPNYTSTYVYYRDALRSNYDIERVTPDGHPTTSSIESDRIDLLLTRAGTDYLEMAKYCLVTVNGLLHRTEGSVDGLIVRHGSASSIIADATNVGILSFANLADFTIIPITDGMVYKQNNRQFLATAAYINTGVDLTGKTPLLVIGGHLQLPKQNPNYHIVGNSEIKVDIGKLGIAQLAFRIVKSMDVQALKSYFEISAVNTLAVSDLQSDDFITALLTLTQSFIVLVNTPDLYTKSVMVESTDLCGSFITNEEPVYPLMTDSGRIEPYWTTTSWDKAILHTPANLRPRYRFETTDWINQVVIDDSLLSDTPYTYDTGYLIKLGRETVTM